MKHLYLFGCVGLIVLNTPAAQANNSSGSSTGYCPAVTAAPGWIITGVTAAPNGKWLVNKERPGPAGSAGVSSIDRSYRSGTGIASIQWSPCSVVHPPEPDPKVIARQMASIFSIPGIVQRGVRRRDEESYFRAVKYEEGGDLLNALKYYNLSASTGVESAIYKLGYFYDLGILVPMDKKKAFDLYSSAAFDKDPVTCGGCYAGCNCGRCREHQRTRTCNQQDCQRTVYPC